MWPLKNEVIAVSVFCMSKHRHASAGAEDKRVPWKLIAQEWATLSFHGKVHFDNYTDLLSERRARF